MTSASNSKLNRAFANKNDEFYTRMEDINKELANYPHYFAGKTIYCNCDDPYQSNFTKYFIDKFEDLELKRLITTSYKQGEQSEFIDYDGKDAFSSKKHKSKLRGDGDFRSDECVEFLKEADVVCTNPPFSLFNKYYLPQLMQYKKKFLIIGNVNSVGNESLFPYLKRDEIWFGFNNGAKKYGVPEKYAKEFPSKVEYGADGKPYVPMGNTCWFTNLHITRKEKELVLMQSYKTNPDDFPKYDNYDAINVGRVIDIPKDWDDKMGVPLSYLDKFNPKQFEIIGLASNVPKTREIDGKTDRFYINGKRLFNKIIIRNKG